MASTHRSSNHSNMNKTAGYFVVLGIAIIGAFYGGLKYDQSKNPQQVRQAGTANIGGFGFRNGGGRGMNGGGFAAGEIIAKDETSITVKLRDGGSKIIFYSGSTEIGKFVNDAVSDLGVGKTVSANGKVNPDGSITAQSIQIRPNLPSATTGSR